MPHEFPNQSAMQALIERELESCAPEVREAFQHFRVIPWQKTLAWEYGKGEQFQSWVFADMGERNVYAAYCLGGHGALGSPWGLVFGNDESFGMDSGWYRSLRDLLRDWGVGGNA